jgi:hypothetical protein
MFKGLSNSKRSHLHLEKQFLQQCGVIQNVAIRYARGNF